MAKRQESLVEAKVAFDYIKGSQFRVVRADGAIGGVTPNGHIHFALFSERPSIPRRIVQRLTDKGELGDLIPDAGESRDSIVREMDVDVFVSVETAEILRDWLNTTIQQAKSQLAQLKDKQ